MRCPEARQQISTFLDGETGLHDEQTFYQHLAACCDCSKYLDEARHTNRLLEKALVHVEPPEDLVERIMSALPEDIEPSRRDNCPGGNSVGKTGTWISRWAAGGALRNVVAASIAAILLVGGLGMSGSASMNDSFAKRVLTASRDGIRRVVDNVFSIIPDKPEDQPPVTNRPVKEAVVPRKEVKEKPVEQAVEKQPERQTVVAVNEIAIQGQEQRVLPRPKKSKEEARAEVFSTVGDTMPILAAQVVPVIVNDSIDNARPLWVSENKMYYLSENRAPEEDTFIVWESDLKGSNRKRLETTKNGHTLENGGGTWSPNHNSVAFVVNKEGYYEIASSDLKGNVKDPITLAENEKPYTGALWEYNPVWSSQGEIAFLTSRFRNTDLMVVDAAGNSRVLTQTPEIENNPTWSPGGERIAYYRFAITPEGLRDGKVFVSDKDGANPLAVTPGMSDTGMIPAWSPDGLRLAVNLYSQDQPENNGIWLVNSDGSGWKQVSRVGGGRLINWSPDGTKIAFTDANGQLLVLELPVDESSTGRLILVEPNDQEGEVQWVSWSPNSKQLLLEWRGEQNKTLAIWRADLPK